MEMIQPPNQHDLYASPVNYELIQRSSTWKIKSLLDIGAGTGNNLRALKKLHPEANSTAITCSPKEAAALQEVADQTLVTDLNHLISQDDWQSLGLRAGTFDLIILSHVLEHLIEPAQVLNAISTLLSETGLLLIALPNICHWRTRLQIAKGNFQYRDDGVLDRSHLRFFTYWTARDLIQNCSSLMLVDDWPVGGAILGPLRNYLPKRITRWLDKNATDQWPNLFGFETHLLAKRIR